MGSPIPDSVSCTNRSMHAELDRAVFNEQRLAAVSNAIIALGEALGLRLVHGSHETLRGVPENPVWHADSLHAALLWSKAMEMKEAVLGAEWVGAPIWPLLLDLYINHHRNVQVSVSSACIASRLQPTTALRWLAVLGRAGLVSRAPDKADRRRVFVSLTALAVGKIEQILQKARTADQKSRGYAADPSSNKSSPYWM